MPEERAVITLDAYKGYDTQNFIEPCLRTGVIAAHIALNNSVGCRAVAAPITQTDGYCVSQQKKKLVKQGFDWANTVSLIRQIVALTIATYK